MGEEIFVGRQAELALISRRLEEARAGRGSLVAISGEPGIGKTRLAQAAAAAARERGFGVFWSQCHDGQYIPPYWPWKQLLRGLLKLLPGSKESSRNRGLASALSEIVADWRPGAARSAAMPKPIAEKARVKILESATSLLRIVSEHRPLLLVMDNLHCADVPSLELLEVVAREMSSSRIVIIGSHRESPAEAGGAFQQRIGALAGQSLFEGIPLSGWDLAGVEECLKECGIADPPAHLVQAVHGRTEGNPLFVVEVARLLQHKGLLDDYPRSSVPAWETYIPQKVRLAISGLVQRLSEPCRDALAAASIVGREFESSLLREIIHKEPAATETLLEEALAHALVEEVPEEPGRYRFTHALIQDVLSDQLPGPRRSALHLGTGEALERRYNLDLEAHAGELARHFDAAGQEAAEKAVVYYKLAGERALRMCGFEDAFEQLSRALKLGEGKSSPPDIARMLFGLAQAQHGLGKFAASVDNHTRAFELFAQNGELDNAVHILEQPLILAEKPMNVTKTLEKAMEILGPTSPRAKALGGKYGLAMYHATGDYNRAAVIFDRALRSARKSSDRVQVTTALVNWGRIETDELHFEKSRAMEEEACRLAVEEGDIWMEGMARASEALALLGLGRLTDAEIRVDLLESFAGRVHIRLWMSLISTLCCAVSRQLGDLNTARGFTDKALRLGDGPYHTWNRADLALMEFEQGNSSHGAELLQLVIDEADRADLPFHWNGWLTLLTSYIAWVAGATVPLSVAESEARKILAAGGVRSGDEVTVSVGLGLIAALRGNHDSAALHYEKLLPYKGLVVCPYLGLTADHILALLSSTAGNASRARDHFDAALAFCRSNGLVLELAYTCRDYAEMLIHGGLKTDSQKAGALCDEATPIAEKAGLIPLTERLALLQGRMTHSKAERRHYPDSLSEREVEVLRLLSEGLGNAQIGERLFISLHTVANHVQKILEKTGASNRTEAAMYAVRHHLADQDAPAR
jgi:DNA-binding CsgD family transcriptional regulator/tetratricopeptide (TPR) repeat protein